MTDIPTGGFVADSFAPVREAFEANLAGGGDLGASFAATLDGETVVDLWGGWADEAKSRPWVKDTLVNVYSTTKTMMALTALLLADRGELDFDAPVARYWPQFAANGKDRIKVSHLMSHSSGLSGWREPITTEDLYDADKVAALLAAQAPYWEPGAASGYHGLTQGYLVGEVVRRITGRTLGTVFRQEIAEPLEADFHMGLAASEDARVADLVAAPAPGNDGSEDMPELARNMATNPGINPADTRTRAWRGAEISAAGGHGNARAIAEVHALLANGGVAKGKRILSEAGCRKALELQIQGVDLVMGGPARFGMGFGLPIPVDAGQGRGFGLPSAMVRLPDPNTLFWGGFGGSLAVIDLDAQVTFAYAMNKLASPTAPDARTPGLANAMWRSLSR